MKHLRFLIILLIPFFLVSCDDLFGPEGGLNEDEIVAGLKRALEIGTDTSCTALNKEDGFYGNQVLKIFLPPEGDIVLENLELLKNNPLTTVVYNELDLQVENVILGINRSAEDASKDAKPIFIDAITTMTVNDGLSILQGISLDSTGQKSASSEFDSLAATHYLEYKTRDGLTTVFSPVIDAVLDKDLGLGFSTNAAWSSLTTYYNNDIVQLALPIVGASTGEVEEVSLGTHAVTKALNGLFNLVGNQERLIRKDPFKWAEDIIQDIFGYVYEEG